MLEPLPPAPAVDPEALIEEARARQRRRRRRRGAIVVVAAVVSGALVAAFWPAGSTGSNASDALGRWSTWRPCRTRASSPSCHATISISSTARFTESPSCRAGLHFTRASRTTAGGSCTRRRISATRALKSGLRARTGATATGSSAPTACTAGALRPTCSRSRLTARSRSSSSRRPEHRRDWSHRRITTSERGLVTVRSRARRVVRLMDARLDRPLIPGRRRPPDDVVRDQRQARPARRLHGLRRRWDIAALAGWWPKWGIGFWVFSSGMVRNLDSTPIELVHAPGATPHIIGWTLSDGVTDAVAASASGSLAIVASTQNAGRDYGTGKEIDTCTLAKEACTPIDTPASAVSLDPAWSPTANLLAYVRAPTASNAGSAWYRAHKLYVYNAATRRSTEIAGLDGISVSTWSSDGKSLLYVAGDALWLASPRVASRPRLLRRSSRRRSCVTRPWARSRITDRSTGTASSPGDRPRALSSAA